MTGVARSPDALRTAIDGAIAAWRPRCGHEVATTLAEAIVAWRADPRLARLAESTGLHPDMIAELLRRTAASLTEDSMHRLITAELGPEAWSKRLAAERRVVAQVVASNVPALAVPAIVHACAIGAVTIVKSGRGDAVSAPAFRDAIARRDPGLAATIVLADWRGGDVAMEAVACARADVVTGTGTDTTVAALRARARTAFVGYGDRQSIVVLRAATTPTGDVVDAIALDTAIADQRGCLSPHAVFVEGGSPSVLDAIAERLVAAFDRVAVALPPGSATIAERGLRRAACDEAEWQGAMVRRGRHGTVLVDPTPGLRAPIGGRTLRVHPLPSAAALAGVLGRDRVECVGLVGEVAPIADALRAAGVSRVCSVGAMQRPPIDWPRGQRRPLAALRGIVERGTMSIDLA